MNRFDELIFDKKEFSNKLLMSLSLNFNFDSTLLEDNGMTIEEDDKDKEKQEDLNKQIEIRKEEELKSRKRSVFIIFFVLFILLRSASFIFVIYILQSNVDILNFLFIGAEIIYFNLLFWNLTSTYQVFKLYEFNKLNIEYFKRSFVDKLIE